MWGHAKRTPPLQVAFLWCQPPFPPPPSSSEPPLVPLIVPANATPILGTVKPSHMVGGTHPPTHWPLPYCSL